MKSPLAILIALLLGQIAPAEESGLGIVGNYRQNCTVSPLAGESALFESYTKSQVEIARAEMQQLPPKPELLRKKEIFESEVNLAKSKCLIGQIAGAIGGQIKAKDFEKRPETRSLLSQLAMYQGMTSRSLAQFSDTDHCISGTMKERLKCAEEVHKKHAHEQTSYNAVEFFMDVYQLALKRNPDLTVLDLGKVMEKRFENDVKHLKALPEPGDEDEDDTGDNNFPPQPSEDDLIPAPGAK